MNAFLGLSPTLLVTKRARDSPLLHANYHGVATILQRTGKLHSRGRPPPSADLKSYPHILKSTQILAAARLKRPLAA